MKQSQSIEIAYLINGEVVSVRRLSQAERVAQRARRVRSGRAHVGCRGGARRRGDAGGTPGAVHPDVRWSLGRRRRRCCGAGGDARCAPCPRLQHRGGHRRRRVLGAGAPARAPDARRLPAGDRPGFHRSHRRRPRAAGGRGAGRARQATGADLPLEIGMRAEVVLRPGDVRGPRLPRRRSGRRRLRSASSRRFARRAFLPLELAALASIFCAVPVGAQIGDADMKSAISTRATPWEIEKALRAEAQTQARVAPPVLRRAADLLPALGLRRRRRVAVA